MNLNKALITFVSGLLLIVAFSVPVFADGQYGQYGTGQETPSEKPREEVVHSTVDAGFGDSPLEIAFITGGFGMALLLFAKATKRVYFLD